MRAPRVPGSGVRARAPLHERDHRGGDHLDPIPNSAVKPAFAKVACARLREGQGVALMQGASAYFRGLSALCHRVVQSAVYRYRRLSGGFILRPV